MDALEKYKAYKAGQLSEEEAHSFEAWMLENEAEAMALEGLADYPEERLEGDLQDLKQQVAQQGERSAKKPPFFQLGAAAAVLLVLAWSMGLFSTKSERLFNKYYAKYEPIEGSVRGANNKKHEQALTLYAEGKCRDLIGFESPEGELLTEVDLLLASCYMEHEHYQLALDVLRDGQAADPNIAEALKWYRILCYLKLERLEEAQQLAHELAEGKGFYAKDAEKLTQALE